MMRNTIKKLSRALLVGMCLCGMVAGSPSAFAADNDSVVAANGKQQSSKDFAAIKKANFEACKAARLAHTAPQPEVDTKAAMCHAYKGHTDTFATFFDTASQRMVLGTLGDSFESDDNDGARYDTNRLIFEVGSKNIMQLSQDEDSPAIKEIYAKTREGVVWFFDQSGAGNTGALWPGLDTRPMYQNAGKAAINPTVTMSLTSIEAPHDGEVFLYTRSGESYEKMLGSADGWPKAFDVSDTQGKHEHMYWSFTRPGTYKLAMKAVATIHGKEQSAEQVYTFHVTNHDVTAGDFADYDGPSFDEDDENDENSADDENNADEDEDDADADGEDNSINVQQSNGAFFINGNNNTVYVTPWPGAKPEQGLAVPSNSGNTQHSQTTQNSGSLIQNHAGTHSSQQNQNSSQNASNSSAKVTKFKDLQGDKLVIDHGHVDIAVYTGESNKVDMAVQEDVTGSHVFRNPDTVVFAVSDAGKTQGVYRIPQTQINGVPWMGWNNQSMNPHKPTQLTLTGVDGPGNVRVWMFGGLGGGDQEIFSTQGTTNYTIPANTHAHANWDFDKPGYYTLHFQASDGTSTVSRSIHVAVGVDPMETPMASVDGDAAPSKPTNPVQASSPTAGKGAGKSAGSGSGSSMLSGHGGSAAFAGRHSGSFGGSSFNSGKSLPRVAKKKHKGLVSKISNKRLAKSLYRQKLGDDVELVDNEPTGIAGLFQRNPVLAYSLLIGGLLAVFGVLGAGIWYLYKHGFINLNWLLRY